MKRLQLDWTRRAQRQLVLPWLALVGAALCAAWVAQSHAVLQQRIEAVQARNKSLAARAQPQRDRSFAPTPEELRQVQSANAIVERLALPWDALFSALEAADSRQLALLSIEPNAREASLRLSGEARSLDELLAYVDRLARQRALGGVHLVSFESVQREGVPVVAFVLAARWLRGP